MDFIKNCLKEFGAFMKVFEILKRGFYKKLIKGLSGLFEGL